MSEYCKGKKSFKSNILLFSDKSRYDEIFSSLEQHNGKITGDETKQSQSSIFYSQLLGRVAKEEMLKSKLSSHVLGKV